MIYIGIDPGLTGAIGVLDHKGQYLEVIDLPTREKEANGKVKKKIDSKELCKTFERITDLGSIPSFCIVEAQTVYGGIHPGTQASILESYGAIQACLEIEEMHFDVAWPSSWKSKMGLTKKPKDYSTAMAIRMFQQAPLRRSKDHNRAEALLLAKLAMDLHLADIPQAANG